MTVKEIFSKEFLFESATKNKHPYKIFYKLDISLIKNKEENNEVQQEPSQEVPQQPVQAEPVQNIQPEVNTALAQQPEIQPQQGLQEPSFSVVTEDDDEQEITDDNTILRKISGELILEQEDVNNIQSIDDIYQKLQESKNEEGAKILDDLSMELLLNLTSTNQLQQELKDKVNYSNYKCQN